MARADADSEFRDALQAWWDQASQIRIEGDVTNTVAGGTQYGPVLQGRDFSGLTFGSSSAPGSTLSAPDPDAAIPGEEHAGAHHVISGGIQFGPVLQGGVIQANLQLPPAVPVALAQLPAITAGFSGRQADLAMLADLLDPNKNTGPVLVSAVAGLAGVGKTTLAVHAGHAALQRGWYQGGVLFIDLHGYDDQPVEPGQALDAMLRALGVRAEHIPASPDERGALYRSVLADIRYPVLVVADNASSEAQVQPLLPGTGPHKVLVTSRHTLAALEGPLVDVRVLDRDASVGLLDAALRLARPADDRIARDPEAATRLAVLCDGLPLALQIAAALLKADQSFGSDELADELQVEHQRLERLRYNDGSGSDGLSVAAAFELSYRKLDEDDARLFRLLPVNTGPDISTASAAVLADRTIGEVREVLAGLARAHLVEAAPGAIGRWRMHDLIRLYAARLSDGGVESDSREQARGRLLSYYATMTTAAVSYLVGTSGADQPDCFKGRNDALDWLDAERSNLVTAASVAVNRMDNRVAFDLCKMLVDFLSWRRYIDDWVSIATIGLRAARNLNDRDEEAAALDLQGLALQGARRFDEAARTHRGAATIFHETGNRRREGRAMYNLGMALEELRLFGEAVVAYQHDVEICRESGDLIGEGITLNALSISLREENRLDEAASASRDAIAIHQETGDRHRVGLALNNLAATLERMGLIDDGIAAGQEAVAILRETRDQYMQGMALVTLGGLLQQAQRLGEGISASQDAIRIFEEIGDLNAEGSALSNLGSALLRMGRFDEAVAAYERAAAISRETNDRHMEGIAIYNLGIALSQSQHFDEAIIAYHDAATIFREAKDSSNEGRTLLSLIMTQFELGYLHDVIATSRNATAIFHEITDRHGEGIALNYLGVALMNVQRFDEAVSACREAAAKFRESGDLESADMAYKNLKMAEVWRMRAR
jgi:tetratricopeptide (TPR) repeat protein